MYLVKLFMLLMLTVILVGCANENDVKLKSNFLSISDLITVNVTNEQNSRNVTLPDTRTRRVRQQELFN